jgi:hypothetical protein
MPLRSYQRRQETLVVPNGGTVSNPTDLHLYRTGNIVFPAALTGTTVNYEVSSDGNTYVALRVPAGTAFANITFAASQAQPLPPELFYFKSFRVLVAAQGAARTFIVNFF